jgi:quercetin dioxygenase-like cupin family protein
LWRLQSSEDLQANLVRLPAGASVGQNVESDNDVLLLVLAGSGEVHVADERHPVAPHQVMLLAKGTVRGLRADETEPLVYLTVHRRKRGLSIGPRPAGA